MRKTQTIKKVGVSNEAVFPFKARWTAYGLCCGLSLQEIKSLHFAELMILCGAVAQAKGAKLGWANALQSEKEDLRAQLNRLNNPKEWHHQNSISGLGSILPWPSEALPVLAEAQTG